MASYESRGLFYLNLNDIYKCLHCKDLRFGGGGAVAVSPYTARVYVIVFLNPYTGGFYIYCIIFAIALLHYCIIYIYIVCEHLNIRPKIFEKSLEFS